MAIPEMTTSSGDSTESTIFFDDLVQNGAKSNLNFSIRGTFSFDKKIIYFSVLVEKKLLYTKGKFLLVSKKK